MWRCSDHLRWKMPWMSEVTHLSLLSPMLPLEFLPYLILHYRIVPVCGHDGKSYSNECLARCAGVKAECKGQCPCDNNNCTCTRFYAKNVSMIELFIKAHVVQEPETSLWRGWANIRQWVSGKMQQCRDKVSCGHWVSARTMRLWQFRFQFQRRGKNQENLCLFVFCVLENTEWFKTKVSLNINISQHFARLNFTSLIVDFSFR